MYEIIAAQSQSTNLCYDSYINRSPQVGKMNREYKIPNSFNWFAKLNLTQFIPWNLDSEIDQNSSINEQFKIECEQNREVLTFGRRQDQDTFAGFEIINGIVMENVIVFHPSFGTNVKGWNIIESEHSDFFEFMQRTVLPEMKEWIPEDDVNDYI